MDDDRVEVPELVDARAEPGTSTRSWVGVGAAIVLAVAAGAALWAAAAGAGPALADQAALRDGIAVRSTGLTAVAVAITTLGSTFAMGVVAVVAGVVLALRRRHGEAVFAVATMATAALLFTLIKNGFDRQRPPQATRLVAVTQESLPSGHATMSVAVVGSLVVLAWAGRTAAARMSLVLVAALWVAAVGGTRIYLGVHWFSDVIAGWLLGGAWLAVCATAWSWWWRRGSLRPAPSSTAR